MILDKERLTRFIRLNHKNVFRPGILSTLRGRLVSFGVLTLSVVLVLVSLFTLVLLQSHLVAGIDERLRAAFAVQEAFASDFSAARQEPDSLGAITADGTVIQAGIYDQHGQLRPIAEPDIAALAAGGGTNGPSTLQLSEGPYRYMSSPLPGGETAILGYSLEPAHSILQQLALVLLLLSLAGLAVATPALYVLTGGTLRSLERLTQFARSVTANNLSSKQCVLDPPGACPRDPAEVVALTDMTTEVLRQIAGSLRERDDKEAQLRRFISDASHELRTPLTIMHGYTEMAAHFAAENPDLTSLLNKIDSGTQRLTDLVASMLTLARANAAEDIGHETFDLSALLEERFFQAMEKYPAHQWNINQHGSQLPFAGDRAQLATAIDALLDNAGKHSGAASSVTAEISAHGNLIEIAVVDNGRGIGPDLNKVFEPFFTADGARTRAKGGNGLGLSISQAIIRAHHGCLTVASPTGKTAFIATLPAPRNGLSLLNHPTGDCLNNGV